MRALVFLLLFLSGCATTTTSMNTNTKEERVALYVQPEDNSFRASIFKDVPCTGAVAELVKSAVKPEYRDGWMEATGTFILVDRQGRPAPDPFKEYAGCWKKHPDEPIITILWEDEQHYNIPMEHFVSDPSKLPAVGHNIINKGI